eukprot:PITA_23719
MHDFLRLEVWQGDEEIFVSQGKYANEILHRFYIDRCKPMESPLAGDWRKEDDTLGEVMEATIYRKLVGSLMYLVKTRLDMCYEVNQISQAMVKLTKLYWNATKNVLRNLRGTTQFGLWYRWEEGVRMQGFIVADWVGSPSNRKSTSRGFFSVGSTAVSWYSRNQISTALSLVESRLLAMSVAMSSGIPDVHLPLISTCTMVSRRVEMKTPLRAHLGIQSIKCLWNFTHENIKLFIDKDIKI